MRGGRRSFLTAQQWTPQRVRTLQCDEPADMIQAIPELAPSPRLGSFLMTGRCCTRSRIGTLLFIAAIGTISLAAALRRPAAEGMAEAAEALVATLDDSQREQVLLPYDAEARLGWHFIPKKERKGLALRDMNDAQQAATLRLVRAALSEAGYDKTTRIMMLEGVLRELEGSGGTWNRDPEGYYVTVFGTPAQADDAWGLSFEGHHLSLNFVCRGNEIVDSTPQFFGANPATIRSDVEGPLGKGARTLADEQDLAFKLLGQLSDTQKSKAVIADEAPADIRAAGEPQPPNEPPAGLSYREMTPEQLETLEQLVGVYASAMPAEVAQARLEAIRAAGWGKVHFAWAGASEPGIGHYYRIQGPTFLIEFANTQPDADGNPANHIHCVWRDMTGDFDLPIAQN